MDWPPTPSRFPTARPRILTITAGDAPGGSVETDRPAVASPPPVVRTPSMPDLVFLASALAFFALAVGYAGLCARL